MTVWSTSQGWQGPFGRGNGCSLALHLVESGGYELTPRGDLPQGRAVFRLQSLHQRCGAGNFTNGTNSLPAAPNFLPRLRLAALAAAAEAHLAGVALGQVVRVEAGRADRLLQIVAVHAGEEARVHDVVAGAFDDRMLVVFARARFMGRDECRTDVREVRAHRLRGQHRAAVGYRA